MDITPCARKKRTRGSQPVKLYLKRKTSSASSIGKPESFEKRTKTRKRQLASIGGVNVTQGVSVLVVKNDLQRNYCRLYETCLKSN